MSVVRPEFGPTLPELLGPRLRALPRWGRALLAVAVLALVAGLAALALKGDDLNTAVVRGPLEFNLVYPDGLERVAPEPGELLRLRSPANSPSGDKLFTVRPIRLPAYRDDINGFLPFFASRLIDEQERSDPDFLLRSEGRVRINDLPGYGYVFQTRVNGRIGYGRRVLLFADAPAQHDGADLLLLAQRSAQTPIADAIGTGGALKTAFRSFRLGTERP